jgi:hypothetical protein
MGHAFRGNSYARNNIDLDGNREIDISTLLQQLKVLKRLPSRHLTQGYASNDGRSSFFEDHHACSKLLTHRHSLIILPVVGPPEKIYATLSTSNTEREALETNAMYEKDSPRSIRRDTLQNFQFENRRHSLAQSHEA